MPIVSGLIRDGLESSVLSQPLKEVWLSIRPDLAQSTSLGEGTRSNPYDGSTPAKFDTLFDPLSGKIGQSGANTLIHIGPGIFRTKGRTEQGLGIGWRVQSGWIFRGAGIHQTTIRLQLGTSDYDPVNALRIFTVFSGLGFLENGAEISDLTIDLNLYGQPNLTSGEYPRIMVSGVNLIGSNVKLTRVRVVGFGTRSSGAECFPFKVGGWAFSGTTPKVASNAQIDRCIVEQPYLGSARETTCALIGIGTDSHGFPKSLLTRNEGIRRCYLNLEFVNRRPAPATHVRKITYTPGPNARFVTFETDYPHNIETNYPHDVDPYDWAEISGSANSAYNDRVKVSSPVSPSDGSSRILQVQYPADPGAPTGGYITLQQSLPPTIRAKITIAGGIYTATTTDKHNRETNDWVIISGGGYDGTYQITKIDRYSFTFTPAGSPAAFDDAWLDRRSPQFVGIASIPLTGGSLVTVNTVIPHLRKPGEYTAIIGVEVPLGETNYYNGYFKILTVLTSKSFQIQLNGTPTSAAGTAVAAMGQSFQATSADAGYGSIMEKNFILNCRVGGTYHDTWVTDEYISRRNYYSNVWVGPYELVGKGDIPGSTEQDDVDATFVSIYRTAKVTSNTGVSPVEIELTTTQNPVVSPGQGLNVQAAGINEVVTITSVQLDGGTGKWRITFNSSLSYTNNANVTFYVLFQVRRQLLIEENIIDLAPMLFSVGAAPVGFQTFGRYVSGTPLVGQINPYTFEQVIVRGNLIRKVNDQPDASDFGINTAIGVDSAKNAIIENNIIGKLQPTFYWESVLRYSNCGTIKAFNNQDNAGKLLQLWNDIRYQNNNAGFYQDLENEAEDWLLNF